jgi:hypothetical protein
VGHGQEDFYAHAMARRLDTTQVERILALSRASLTPQRIAHLMRVEFKGIRITAQDITNTISREHRQEYDGQTLAEWFIRELDSSPVWESVTRISPETDRITSVFLMHRRAKEQVA